MNVTVKNTPAGKVALLSPETAVLTSVDAALDFIATINYDYSCNRVIIPKEAVVEDFFELRSGLAGEILQKFITYQFKIAIVGDFSAYTSKALRDFIYESNQGKDIFFLPTADEALERLGKA